MKYDRDSCSVELSVEELCALVASSGDLGGYRAFGDLKCDKKERLRILQSEADGFYNTEVELLSVSSAEDIYFTVSGIADGIIRRSDGGVTVDVIRNVGRYEFSLPPSEYLLSRLRCYAYFLCVRDGMESVAGRVTYYNVETKKTKHFKYRFETSFLKDAYASMLQRIVKRARHAVFRAEEGLSSAAAAVFPYPELREGQEMMIRECYSAIKHGKRIFAEAPTGTGKTMSSLYPAVRALGEGYMDRIFYLTAKASVRREAYHAAARLFETGVKLRTIVITAKEQMCPNCHGGAHEPCDHSLCPRAKGYYDRVGKAVEELLSEHSGYPRGLIAEVAARYGVCPYELSLDLSEYCDIIICDYNYAFDPAVYFRRYFSEDRGEKYVFLIDEAHNLSDRARDMYSAHIKRSQLIRLAKAFEERDGELCRYATDVGVMIDRMRSLCRDNMTKDAEGNEQGFYVSREPMDKLDEALELLRKKGDTWLRKHRHETGVRLIENILSDIRRYLAVSQCFNTGFLCYVEVFSGDVTVKNYCLDPSYVMNSLLNRATSSILFSATLTPPEYFCHVLGGAKEAESIALPSPFDPKDFCVSVLDGISVRSEDREKNYLKYVKIIAATVIQRRGNYIAYFPTYECLEGVLKVFKTKYPNVETVAQSRGMGASDKDAFLSAFKDDSGHLRVGFCVLGGAFAEGVDLPGSRLIGVLVFGVGIPALSNERNIIMEYFDNTTGNGYDYAYTYPGMTRVLQAVGRVIRREGDRGIAVLVDDRYSEPKYRALFPQHWENIQYTGNARSLSEIMRRFWKNTDMCE